MEVDAPLQYPRPLPQRQTPKKKTQKKVIQIFDSVDGDEEDFPRGAQGAGILAVRKRQSKSKDAQEDTERQAQAPATGKENTPRQSTRKSNPARKPRRKRQRPEVPPEDVRASTPPPPPPKSYLTLRRIQTRKAAPIASPKSGVQRRNRFKWVPAVVNTAPRRRSITTKRRVATLYDAAAGRVNYEGFIKPAFENEYGETTQRSMKVQPTDQVLGRRRRFPALLEEDFDFTEENVPDSDLLTAVHQYVADLYEAHGLVNRGSYIFDETALVGIGILIEERVRAVLGQTGHLALVDPEEGFDDGGSQGKEKEDTQVVRANQLPQGRERTNSEIGRAHV